MSKIIRIALVAGPLLPIINASTNVGQTTSMDRNYRVSAHCNCKGEITSTL
jgi:hypothetical protein